MGRGATGNRQRKFIEGKLCLTDSFAFCDGTTDYMDSGEMRVLYILDIIKAFNTVSHSIFVSRPGNCELGQWLLRWVNNQVEFVRA